MSFRTISTLFFALCLSFAGNASAAQKKTTPSTKPAAKPAESQKKKPVPAEVYAVDPSGKPPEVRAAAYILLDANTGQVLLESNADAQRPVASTQKLLTALIVAESGDLAENVRVEVSDTWTEPSMLYIKPGENYSRLKLMQILLVHSMNDVARCLARDNAGSIEAFAQRMNAKARQLGMFDSHFLNPNGLPLPGQYSTARDMAKVGMAAYRNRTLRSTVAMKSMNWTFNDGRVKLFETTNRVLKNYALCNGMKTGYTNASGPCLISSASNGNRDVIAVVLGAQKGGTIWTDSYRLLAWGLTN